jgi:signal transduction histidine kinase
MRKIASLEDLIGLDHGKIGHYEALQMNMHRLEIINDQLQQSRAEIQTILDGLTDIMLVLNDHLEIIRANRVFFNQFPEIEGQLKGWHCYQIFGNADVPCENCPAVAALHTDSTVHSSRIYEIDEAFRHFDIIATPLVLGGTRRVQIFYRDVTRDKQLLAKYTEAEKMATVGVLAAGVAHEINNPLAAIQGFAEGLKRRMGKIAGKEEVLADFCEYTDTILSECSRCRNIVRNLLSFSRPVAARRSSTDINRCIRDTLFILKNHLEERGSIQPKLELDEALPNINGDESQLKQVIINLCTNAIDAMSGVTGHIIISSARSEKNGTAGVEFTIRDEGCGILPQHREKLFEPFFTTKTVGKGVGIGLSTCYTIVASHNGEISVKSTPGKGAAFTVYLPVEAP